MTWYQTMGYISTVALLLPVALISCLRLYKNRSLLILMLYYLSAFIYNLLSEKIISISPSYIRGFGIFNNLLDVPFALMYLLYFTKSPGLRRKIYIAILSFLAFEVLVTALFGFSRNTITIILGPGILLIVLLSFIFFIDQIKEVIQHGKAAGKALMASSTLFLYGCFFIIYLFWYVYKTPDVENAFLVYFFVVTLSAMLASIGLVIEKKRLSILDELKTTQNELSRLYPNEKIAFPKETAG
ncbi:MAG: hypothetical protein JWM28_3669 [Chitinophagaceae bacterium]|nr:hypothetical protein [Chitinophagaceae bacterium]